QHQILHIMCLMPASQKGARTRMGVFAIAAVLAAMSFPFLVPRMVSQNPPPSASPSQGKTVIIDAGQNPVAAANRAFEQAWTTPDKVSVDRMLMPDFTWLDADGVLLDRAEALANWPKLTALSSRGEVYQRAYNRVSVLQVHA